MKYFMTFAMVLLLGAGCFGGGSPEVTTDDTSADDTTMEETTQPDVIATNPQAAWNSIVRVAENGDCEAFLSLMTERLELTEADCQEFFTMVEEDGFPEMDWGASETDENSSKLFMDSGRSLTTMVKGDDGVWRADTVFWK